MKKYLIISLFIILLIKIIYNRGRRINNDSIMMKTPSSNDYKFDSKVSVI